jgi:hypothetical protein
MKVTLATRKLRECSLSSCFLLCSLIGCKRLELIDQNVARGSHFVECMLLGSEGTSVSPFKIIGVFAT